MAIMMRVKASRPNVTDPHNGRKIPENRATDVRVSSATMKLVNQGVLVRQELPKPMAAKPAAPQPAPSAPVPPAAVKAAAK